MNHPMPNLLSLDGLIHSLFQTQVITELIPAMGFHLSIEVVEYSEKVRDRTGTSRVLGS